MLDEISIGLTMSREEAVQVRALLERSLAHLGEQHGITVQIDDTAHLRDTAMLDCRFYGAEATHHGEPLHLRHLCRQAMSRAVTDFIVEQWEDRLVHRMVESYYEEFYADEKDLIHRNTRRLLEEHQGERWEGVAARVLEYLMGHDSLHVQGFVTFRLKDYMAGVEDAVDQAVDDFLLEREYREFIRLLQYFVEYQEPQVEMVHVFTDRSGGYRLVDDQGEALDREGLEDMVAEWSGDGAGFDPGDLLVSALISISPGQILLHRAAGPGSSDALAPETVDTIRRVFEGRVYVCGGCSMCRQGGGGTP